ncbi:unnamed protein product [Boreogadus saida]
MEDRKLIIAVCLRPVLYNTMMVSYRDRNKKERAWVDVAEDTGFPVDVCRRKWKSLRDRYMRHKKSEQEGKKSGSAAGTVTRWKFAGVLSFLDPFVTPRETSSNLPRGAEETSPAVSQRTLMLLLLLLLSLSLPLALHVYLSLRLALPQEHRAGRRGREPGYQRGTTQSPPTKYPQPSSRPYIVVLTLLFLPLPRSLGLSTMSWA